MKKFLFILTFMFLLIPSIVEAKNVNIYLFYGESCPHCAALEEYLDKNYSNDDEIKVYKYEVWNNTENQKLLQKVENVTEEPSKGVPYFVIGEEVLQGYSEGKAWENKVDNAIEKAKKENYHDNVGITLGVVEGK